MKVSTIERWVSSDLMMSEQAPPNHIAQFLDVEAEVTDDDEREATDDEAENDLMIREFPIRMPCFVVLTPLIEFLDDETVASDDETHMADTRNDEDDNEKNAFWNGILDRARLRGRPEEDQGEGNYIEKVLPFVTKPDDYPLWKIACRVSFLLFPPIDVHISFPIGWLRIHRDAIAIHDRERPPSSPFNCRQGFHSGIHIPRGDDERRTRKAALYHTRDHQFTRSTQKEWYSMLRIRGSLQDGRQKSTISQGSMGEYTAWAVPRRCWAGSWNEGLVCRGTCGTTVDEGQPKCTKAKAFNCDPTPELV